MKTISALILSILTFTLQVQAAPSSSYVAIRKQDQKTFVVSNCGVDAAQNKVNCRQMGILNMNGVFHVRDHIADLAGNYAVGTTAIAVGGVVAGLVTGAGSVAVLTVAAGGMIMPSIMVGLIGTGVSIGSIPGVKRFENENPYKALNRQFDALVANGRPMILQTTDARSSMLIQDIQGMLL